MRPLRRQPAAGVDRPDAGHAAGRHDRALEIPALGPAGERARTKTEPKSSLKGPVNTILQGSKPSKTPLENRRMGEKRQPKVLRPPSAGGATKNPANIGVVPHPSRFVPDSPASQDFCSRTATNSRGSCASIRSHGRVSPLTRRRPDPTRPAELFPRLFSRSTPEMRRFARRSTGSTCWPSASATAFHRSRDTIVTCRVRLRFASSTRPAPARSSTRERGSIGPRRQRLRQILSSLPAIPLQRFPQMVHKGPVNTLFQGVKTVHPPLDNRRRGENRGTKVLNTVEPRRLPKTTANTGVLSRIVPHPKTFVRAEAQRRAGCRVPPFCCGSAPHRRRAAAAPRWPFVQVPGSGARRSPCRGRPRRRAGSRSARPCLPWWRESTGSLPAPASQSRALGGPSGPAARCRGTPCPDRPVAPLAQATTHRR